MTIQNTKYDLEPLLAQPTVRSLVPCAIINLAISFGAYSERLESMLCDLVNRDRLLKMNKSSTQSTTIREQMIVVERRIRVKINFRYL